MREMNAVKKTKLLTFRALAPLSERMKGLWANGERNWPQKKRMICFIGCYENQPIRKLGRKGRKFCLKINFSFHESRFRNGSDCFTGFIVHSLIPKVVALTFVEPGSKCYKSTDNVSDTGFRLAQIWRMRSWSHHRNALQPCRRIHLKQWMLTLSVPRVINLKFPLQPHQKYYITQYEELGFS